MNFAGYIPHAITRFSSVVEQDDPTNLPLGVSPWARNVRFYLTGVRTRDGIQNRYGFTLADPASVTGLAALKYSGNPDLQVPIAFSSVGTLYKESPVGSGQVVRITGPQVPLPVGASMQVAAAYQKGYLAFTDLVNSLGTPCVYNLLTSTLDPLSMRPVGQPWTAATAYQLGEVITPATPIGGNGHTYQCTVAGTSGANQPAFPVTEGGTVVDNTVTWKEVTPVLAQALPEPSLVGLVTHAGAGGAFAAGRDVYLIATLVNGIGETDPSLPGFGYNFINTVGSDKFTITPPALAAWMQALPAPYAATGYNIYEADVATGNPAPARSAFQQVNGAAIALNANATVTNTGTGAAPPTTNGAMLVPAGNICSGLRYMVVLFVNRNGYISGMTTPSVVSYNGSTNGFQLYGAHIPTGPANTVARICAFTPAGQLTALAGKGISTAGPYFWISPQFPNGIFNLSAIPAGVNIADVVNGEQITATLINDNVSTTATFNFDDIYLEQTLQDVSAYFRKIQVTQVSDAYFAKTLKRVLYKSDLYPSGWYVSLQDDPESVYGDTGVVQAAENDGTRGTAVRELGGVVYLMKEKSGHVMTNISNDPANTKWDVQGAWKGSGPCGPRAVDVSTNFMCYVHRSGVYIFEGGSKPYRISKEIPITWKRINWAAKKTIWVMIDDETREIRIGVPYGKSAVPNLVLKCSYEELPDAESTLLFSPPIRFSMYVGKEIANGSCYKWSVDDIAANLAIRAERVLTPPNNGWPQDFDLANADSQILYASSNPDGHVDPIITGVFDDNGQGIDSSVETACPPDDPQTGGNLLRPNRLGGVQLNIAGQGQGSVYVLALRGKDQSQGAPPVPVGKTQATAGAELLLKKPWIAGVPYSCGGSMTNERMRLRVTNNKRAGVAFDLKWACIYATPVTSARPN